MKQLIIILALFTLNTVVFATAFAQDQATTPHKKPAKKKAVTKAPPPPPTVEVEHESTSTSPLKMSAGFSIGVLNSAFALGPSFKIELPKTIDGNHFRFGGETGFYYVSKNGVHGFAIPLMATGTYLMNIPGEFKPYFGAGLGISFDHASTGDVTVGPVTVSGTSSTDVHFAFLAIPGMSFGNDGKFYAEIPIGTLYDGFAVLPTFGMHF